MSMSTSFRWRSMTEGSVIGARSSGAASVASRMVRANVPLSDVSSPKVRAQKATSGARLNSVRNGIGLISALTVASTPANPTARLFVTFVMALIVAGVARGRARRSEEHTSELQSRLHLVCRLLLEKKKRKHPTQHIRDTKT